MSRGWPTTEDEERYDQVECALGRVQQQLATDGRADHGGGDEFVERAPTALGGQLGEILAIAVDAGQISGGDG
jgi:hypothetical protein